MVGEPTPDKTIVPVQDPELNAPEADGVAEPMLGLKLTVPVKPVAVLP